MSVRAVAGLEQTERALALDKTLNDLAGTWADSAAAFLNFGYERRHQVRTGVAVGEAAARVGLQPTGDEGRG